MRKVMQQIEVSVRGDGEIWISQATGCGDDAVVSLSPDQVDVLTLWLKEAQAEASKIRAEQPAGAE